MKVQALLGRIYLCAGSQMDFSLCVVRFHYCCMDRLLNWCMYLPVLTGCGMGKGDFCGDFLHTWWIGKELHIPLFDICTSRLGMKPISNPCNVAFPIFIMDELPVCWFADLHLSVTPCICVCLVHVYLDHVWCFFLSFAVVLHGFNSYLYKLGTDCFWK